MPWLAHLFGIRPWEIKDLEYDDFEELSRLVDMWLENGGRWQRPAGPTSGEE